MMTAGLGTTLRRLSGPQRSTVQLPFAYPDATLEAIAASQPDSSAGATRISEESTGDNRPGSGLTPFALLQKRFAQVGAAQVKALMPEVLKRAEAAMQAAAPRGKFGHASEGKDISQVLTAEFALSLA